MLTNVLLTMILSASAAIAGAAFGAGCNCGSDQLTQLRTQFHHVLSSIPSSGFHRFDSNECSSQSSLVRHSIIRMVLPAAESKSVRDLLGNDGPDVRMQLIEMIRKDSTLPPSTNDINIWELENCIRIQASECQISTAYRSSTIVLTGNGTESVTAFHNLKLFFAPYLKDAKRKGLTAQQTADHINQISIPAFLYNSQGKLVGQPKDVSVRPRRISADQVLRAWNNLATKQMVPFADNANLTFSRKLGPGVRIAQRIPQQGEKVKIFGYPDRTHAWKEVGGSDSDGHSMYCSTGSIISTESAANRFKWNFNSLSNRDKELYRLWTIFTDSSSFGGMSGGGVFNEEGELVATHSSGSNAPIDSVTSDTLVLRAP